MVRGAEWRVFGEEWGREGGCREGGCRVTMKLGGYAGGAAHALSARVGPKWGGYVSMCYNPA